MHQLFTARLSVVLLPLLALAGQAGCAPVRAAGEGDSTQQGSLPGKLIGVQSGAQAGSQNGVKSEAPNPPAQFSEGWREEPALGSFYLVMSKRSNELSVRSLSDAGKIYRVFRAISGTNMGDKIREGDKKTPEGIYFVEAKVAASRMRPMHGPAAFELNYPNAVDRIFHRTGHGIWIHGVDKDSRMEKRFDTLGCVAVANKDIVDLGRFLSMRNTPIVIVDSDGPEQRIGIEPTGGPLAERVREWARVWSSRDADAYMKFYSPDFYARKMNFAAWDKYKRRLVRQYKSINVELSDLKVLRHGKYSVAIFMQHYLSDRYKADSLKRLYLVGDGAQAQILAEEVAQESASALEPAPGAESSGEPAVTLAPVAGQSDAGGSTGPAPGHGGDGDGPRGVRASDAGAAVAAPASAAASGRAVSGAPSAKN